MRRLAVTFFSVLLGLVWPILLISATLSFLDSQPWFYTLGWARHNVSATTGLSSDELDRIARQLVEYFETDQQYLDVKIVRHGQLVDLFNPREVEHMKDVKGLVRFGYTVLWVSLLYAAIFASAGLFWWKGRYRFTVYRVILWGGLFTLLIIGAIAAMVLFNFQGFFLGFHLLSFSNDFWQLDPARDYLIRVFPERFFYEASLLIGAAVVLEATVVGAVMWRLLKQTVQKV